MTQSTNLKLDLLSATDLFDTDKIKSNFEKIDSNVLIPTKIIDNCVTDNSLLPLSAKQGKLLQDQITKLNGDLFTYEQKFEYKDLNTIISPGCYGVGGKPSVYGVTNYPEDTTGMLVVFYNTGVTIQHYYTYLGSMYLRSKLNNFNDWSSWEKITK